MDDLGAARHALQGMWDAAKILVQSELPDAVVVVGPTKKRHAKCVRPTQINEGNVQVVIDPLVIETGDRAAQALMHSATHALADTRGIKVLSTNLRHHLYSFLGVAEDLELVHPPSANDSTSMRFYEVALSREARARYRKPLHVLLEVWPSLRGGFSPFTSATDRRFRVLCPACGRAAGRMSQKQFDDGPWTHRPCGTDLVIDPRDIENLDLAP
ncbi:hypothetical protein [Crossiella sp. CA198]|uniref:hypothetical protein n=1 Tax=Crossiella sp. CA198 TaxID=3455607 RepID=UPI003F8D07CD